MGLREYANNNPAVMTGAAVLVLVLCLAAIACSFFGGFGMVDGSDKLVYYDMNAGTIKLVSSGDFPGSPLKDNDQAFRATVMSCGECGEISDGMTPEALEANGMFIANLNAYPTTDQGAGSGDRAGGAMILLFGGENPQWHDTNSPEGIRASETVMNWPCENGGTATRCQP
ncbi:MAG: hypothetical protein AAGA29_01605 [Planctomycetota bacterium]